METFGFSQAQISLLYVEDDPVTRNILSQMLPMKFPGITLIVAENGAIGLEKYREHRPHIVVTDINMPIMDGIRMATEIKGVNPDALIIVCSAYSDASFLVDAIEIGVNHYLLKPIDYKKLFAMIDKCVAGILLERRLREQNEHIRKLSRAVEQSPNMVMITDAGGAIEYVNPRFSEVTGYGSVEVVGQTPVSLNPATTDFCQALQDAIGYGRGWRGERLNRKKNGATYWESAAISPLYDEAGTITHFVAIAEDITLRKEAAEKIELLNTDLSARARELEEANQELDAFNHTVSHDLRAPLAAISGFSQVLLELCGTKLDEQCTEYIQQIQKSAHRMDSLIDTLLDFSRLSRTALVRDTVDLSALAHAIAATLKVTTPERKVTFTIASGMSVTGDAALLRIVLENLLGNAWKYTRKCTEAVIEFGTTLHDGKSAFFVSDNGAGFNMAEADRLFTPFARLHDRQDFEGHGIGLVTVQRIIQRHDGQVWAAGEPGKGATFFFMLP